MLSLEAVWALPLLVLLGLGLVHTVAFGRDVLVAHEAARAGARAAATSTGEELVVRAARDAAQELDVRVDVAPVSRSDGDIVTVTIEADRRIGAVVHTISASAHARVEPVVTPEPGHGARAPAFGR